MGSGENQLRLHLAPRLWDFVNLDHIPLSLLPSKAKAAPRKGVKYLSDAANQHKSAQIPIKPQEKQSGWKASTWASKAYQCSKTPNPELHDENCQPAFGTLSQELSLYFHRFVSTFWYLRQMQGAGPWLCHTLWKKTSLPDGRRERKGVMTELMLSLSINLLADAPSCSHSRSSSCPEAGWQVTFGC